MTGGIGAGKSTVVEAFARRGAVPFSADAAVHALYHDPEVVAAVRERWGDQVVDDASGAVDRSAIADIVFNDEVERRWLEALLHPRVGAAWLAFADEQAALAEPPDFLVAEVPLLFEAGLQDRYDAVVVITAPHATRMERAAARGSARSLPAERAAAQMSEREKAERSDYAYVNTGSFEELDAFAHDVLAELRHAER
ncbi:MAG: dephospho-CoA kinase [Thermoleophilia bacterium]|nr:dephospho-CoA kinase [Thermoleophilia bacterium]